MYKSFLNQSSVVKSKSAATLVIDAGPKNTASKKVSKRSETVGSSTTGRRRKGSRKDTDSSDMSLNIRADTFVPNRILSINSTIADVHWVSRDSLGQDGSQSSIKSVHFNEKDVTHALRPNFPDCDDVNPPEDEPLHLVTPLCTEFNDHYASNFKTLLQMEHESVLDAYEQYSLYQVQNTSTQNDYLTFNVPGLADLSPPLKAGDWALVRCISFQGEYRARVISTRNIDSSVHVEWHGMPGVGLFKLNVRFIPSTVTMATSLYSMKGLTAYHNESGKARFGDLLLFPNSSEVNQMIPVKLDRINKQLNQEQLTAVQQVLSRTKGASTNADEQYLRTPFVILGPAGI
jgi:hypothetical protein